MHPVPLIGILMWTQFFKEGITLNVKPLLLAAALMASAGPASGGDLPSRDQVPQELRWRLEDIYPTDARWEEEFRAVQEQLPRLEAFRGKLSSPKELAACLKLRDQLSIAVGKLYAYAVMRSHEDTANPTYQALSDRASSLATLLGAKTSFIEPELVQLPRELLRSFLDEPSLKDHRFFLSEVIRKSPHVLSREAEELVASMGEVLEVPERSFEMLTNADMTFAPIRDEKGKRVEMSEERYYRFLRSKDRRVRREAYESLYDAYSAHENTLGATFGGMLKASSFLAKTRKYPSVLAMELFDDAIPEEVYRQLVDTVESNLKPLHRYIDLRAKALKLDQLAPYDLHVPLAEEIHRDIPWDRAKEMVLEALSPLGEDYVRKAREGLASGWVDVVENRGKRGGAYSWGSYGTHPYILMNYDGTISDVFTLAHELGHSMHTLYSHSTQPYPTSDYSIFVAEVASTVNEMLLLEHLIRNAKDPKEKLYLINYQLDQIRSTLYRQTMFASFEREVHRRHQEGEPTSPRELRDLWGKLNRRYHGPNFQVDQRITMEWARIPHFYSPFYVFQYATGISAAISLSEAILKDPSARDRYLNMLSRGGSAHPIELLKDAGVDMTSPRPVLDAIGLFDRRLGEMETLLDQAGR